MPNFYLDIETTGKDPKRDQIITIQFARFDSRTGKRIGNLKILKSWESDEKEIIKKFIEESGISDPNVFSFVPVGFNLGFEHNFFIERCRVHNLPAIDVLLNRPFIDLKSLCVIMNNGSFKGSGLDKITGKPHSGEIVPKWFSEKKYDEIENYIVREAQEFEKFCSCLHKELPDTLKKFKSSSDTKK